MEEEYFISGFCRSQNQTRTITLCLEKCGNEVEVDADCLYGKCQHQGSCEIAHEIEEKVKDFA